MRTVYHINSTWASTAPGQKLMHMIYEIYVFLQINMAFKSILAIILTSTKKIPPWVLQSALSCEQVCGAFTLHQFFSLPHFLNTDIKINFTTNSSITPTLICSQCRCNVDTELLLARGDGNNESRAYSQPPLSPPTLPSRPGLERPGRDGGKSLAYEHIWGAGQLPIKIEIMFYSSGKSSLRRSPPASACDQLWDFPWEEKAMQWNSSLIVKISKASVLQEWPVAAPLMLPGPEHVHKSNNDSLDLFLKDCITVSMITSISGINQLNHHWLLPVSGQRPVQQIWGFEEWQIGQWQQVVDYGNSSTVSSEIWQQ